MTSVIAVGFAQHILMFALSTKISGMYTLSSVNKNASQVCANLVYIIYRFELIHQVLHDMTHDDTIPFLKVMF
jgi:hypothetical protein